MRRSGVGPSLPIACRRHRSSWRVREQAAAAAATAASMQAWIDAEHAKYISLARTEPSIYHTSHASSARPLSSRLTSETFAPSRIRRHARQVVTSRVRGSEHPRSTMAVRWLAISHCMDKGLWHWRIFLTWHLRRCCHDTSTLFQPLARLSIGLPAMEARERVRPYFLQPQLRHLCTCWERPRLHSLLDPPTTPTYHSV